MRLPWDTIVIDLETAGDETGHRIVEIGAVRLDPDLRIQDNWASLVDGRPVSPEVVRIHGLTDEQLAGAPTFAQAHVLFDEWCKLSDFYLLSAFGAYFDVPVLRAEYSRIGMKFPHRGEVFDIKTVAWWEFFKRGLPCKGLKLDRALDLAGLKFEGPRHRALPDAINEARLLRALAGKRDGQ